MKEPPLRGVVLELLCKCRLFMQDGRVFLEGPSFVFINIARPSSLLNNLVLGGLGLVGGYLATSVLTPLISHHAATPAGSCDHATKDCRHLGNLEALDPCYIGKCGAGLLPFTQKAAGQIKISPADAAANKSQPALDFNPADNLPGGPNDQIIKTIAGNGCGAIFAQVPVLGQVPCWAIILGAVGLIFLGPSIARKL